MPRPGLSLLTRGRPTPAAEVPGGRVRTLRRVVTARAVTVLAGLLVFVDLVAPDRLVNVRTAAFLRIPIEALVGGVVLLVIPARARRPVAALGGAVLGALTIGKVLDLGFYSTLVRPFDPVLDWGLLDDAYGFLLGSIGRAGAIAAAVAAALLGAALLVLSALSAVRVAGVAARHRTATTRGVVGLTALWIVCAVLGAQIAPGMPVASTSAAGLVGSRVQQIRAGVHDQQVFAKEASVDAFRHTPSADLLTGLRGKDVLFSFIESYGRSAVQDPQLASIVGPALAEDNRKLHAAGFAARSGFLTSPTSGGGSWLAHSTLMSGLWINNQQRYRDLLHSDRLTLPRAFGGADWRTVSFEPGTIGAWPEGTFYGYDRLYPAKDLGYHGPSFTLRTMPDQYTLTAFQRLEHSKPKHAPLMAELTLVSSHSPWAPVPRPLGWSEVGDGSVYNTMIKQVPSANAVWSAGTSEIRASYARSVVYSVDSLISYVQKYGDDKTVLVFLGDHQPAPIITGDGASRDVPITIVAHDPAVLDRISSWGWEDGLKPSPHAPVWRMNDFRDRFLRTFASQGEAGRAPTR